MYGFNVGDRVQYSGTGEPFHTVSQSDTPYGTIIGFGQNAIYVCWDYFYLSNTPDKWLRNPHMNFFGEIKRVVTDSRRKVTWLYGPWRPLSGLTQICQQNLERRLRS